MIWHQSTLVEAFGETVLTVLNGLKINFPYEQAILFIGK